MKIFEQLVPMSQKAHLIYSVRLKQILKKSFEKVKSWESKKLKNRKIFMIFVLQKVPNFGLGDENFRKNYVHMSQKAH